MAQRAGRPPAVEKKHADRRRRHGKRAGKRALPVRAPPQQKDAAGQPGQGKDAGKEVPLGADARQPFQPAPGETARRRRNQPGKARREPRGHRRRPGTRFQALHEIRQVIARQNEQAGRKRRQGPGGEAKRAEACPAPRPVAERLQDDGDDGHQQEKHGVVIGRQGEQRRAKGQHGGAPGVRREQIPAEQPKRQQHGIEQQVLRVHGLGGDGHAANDRIRGHDRRREACAEASRHHEGRGPVEPEAQGQEPDHGLLRRGGKAADKGVERERAGHVVGQGQGARHGIIKRRAPKPRLMPCQPEPAVLQHVADEPAVDEVAGQAGAVRAEQGNKARPQADQAGGGNKARKGHTPRNVKLRQDLHGGVSRFSRSETPERFIRAAREAYFFRERLPAAHAQKKPAPGRRPGAGLKVALAPSTRRPG